MYHLTLAASSLMLFVLATKGGPTVEESQTAAIKAKELLGKQAKRNIAAKRCYDSIGKLPETTVSPRTQFMIGIGAIQNPVSVPGSGSGVPPQSEE